MHKTHKERRNYSFCFFWQQFNLQSPENEIAQGEENVAQKTARHCVRIALVAPSVHAAEVSLLNVSYDPTRELYQEFNKAFAKEWKAKAGDDLKLKTSHGGSGKQGLSLIHI